MGVSGSFSKLLRGPKTFALSLGLTVLCVWLLCDKNGFGSSGRTGLDAALCGKAASPLREEQLQNTAVEAAAVAAEPDSDGIRHVYVVGSGHSGTSVLLRTVGNLPGLRCLIKETYLYVDHQDSPQTVPLLLKKWDGWVTEGNYHGWVEKTPKHIYFLDKMFERDPSARVINIVRDGRDVVASFRQRGLPFESSKDKWLMAGKAVQPHLNNPQYMTVRFEDFVDKFKVLGVLQQLSAFVGTTGSTERLLLALQPASEPLVGHAECRAYASEQEKQQDLAASYLMSLAGASKLNAEIAGNVPELDRRNNTELRSWQVSQAWSPVASRWEGVLTAKEKELLASDQEFQGLLKQFGYI